MTVSPGPKSMGFGGPVAMMGEHDHDSSEMMEEQSGAVMMLKGGKGDRMMMSSNSNFRPGRWTKEEHQRFLAGFELYGHKWRKVRDVVGTRTVTQVRTHAQKFFVKMKKTSDGIVSIKSPGKQSKSSSKTESSGELKSILHPSSSSICKSKDHSGSSERAPASPSSYTIGSGRPLVEMQDNIQSCGDWEDSRTDYSHRRHHSVSSTDSNISENRWDNLLFAAASIYDSERHERRNEKITEEPEDRQRDSIPAINSLNLNQYHPTKQPTNRVLTSPQRFNGGSEMVVERALSWDDKPQRFCQHPAGFGFGSNSSKMVNEPYPPQKFVDVGVVPQIRHRMPYVSPGHSPRSPYGVPHVYEPALCR